MQTIETLRGELDALLSVSSPVAAAHVSGGPEASPSLLPEEEGAHNGAATAMSPGGGVAGERENEFISQLSDLRDDYVKKSLIMDAQAADLQSIQALGTSLQVLMQSHSTELRTLAQQRQDLAQHAQTLLHTSSQQQQPSAAISGGPMSPPGGRKGVVAPSPSPEEAVEVRRMAHQMGQLESAVSRQSRALDALGEEKARLESQSLELQGELDAYKNRVATIATVSTTTAPSGADVEVAQLHTLVDELRY
jgi:hypothetical protein